MYKEQSILLLNTMIVACTMVSYSLQILTNKIALLEVYYDEENTMQVHTMHSKVVETVCGNVG